MPDLPHSLSKYTNEDCRCDVCKRSASHYQKDKREANYAQRVLVNGRMVSTLVSCKHGTITGYKSYGCRCDHCTKAMRDNNWGKRGSKQ